jgi:FKBP-type peptidyl-prolyl cis-trans isomerase
MMLKQTLCLATVVLLASVGAMAQTPTPAPTPAPAPAPAEQKKPTFAVVAIGEDMKVMNENAIEQLRKDKQAAYEKALAAHNKAKKEAEDAGKPFTEKAPMRETVEVKKGGFATEALAKAHLEELQKAKKDDEKK